MLSKIQSRINKTLREQGKLSKKGGDCLSFPHRNMLSGGDYYMWWIMLQIVNDTKRFHLSKKRVNSWIVPNDPIRVGWQSVSYYYKFEVDIIYVNIHVTDNESQGCQSRRIVRIIEDEVM